MFDQAPGYLFLVTSLHPTQSSQVSLCHESIPQVSLLACSILLAAFSCAAAVKPYPPGFKTQTIAANGTHIFVRVGGHGPAVVLLHGYGESGDMWQPLAVTLAHNHTVIVPDLRGMGLSAHPTLGL